MSVTQVIVNIGILFVLYRYLFNVIGIERLGIWSVVLATTSVANFTDLGFSASVVKFVAKYLSRGEEKSVSGVIQTSAISISLFAGLILLIVYPFADWLLNLIMPAASLREALSILPYSLLSLWVMLIAGVFKSGLDGYQQIYLRNMLLMASGLFHLFLCFVIVPTHGLMGLAYARVAQNGLVLVGSWTLLKRKLSILPVIPYHFDRKLFKEMIGYGLNFQVISVSQIISEPIVKALLTKFGSLSMTGFYEMASKMILHLRELIVAAYQVIVPVIADLQEKEPEIIQKVYKASYRILLYIALPIFSGIIAFAPFISQVWIGSYENIFVLYAVLLACGWFFNTLELPPFFANLGIGELRWNTIGRLTTTISSFGLGLLLGNIYNATGVVAARVISLVTCSLIIPVSYHYRYKIPINEIFGKENIGIGLASVVSISISLFLYYKMNNTLSLPTLATLIVSAFFVIMFIPFWQHPMRKQLMSWVSEGLFKT
jgi:O-antigen/teichoic acid export membrane protein